MVDASALVAFLTDDEGADGRWARDILADGDMSGPELVLVESSNIIRRLEHTGGVTDSVAASAHRDLVEHEIELYSFAPYAERVWELRHNLTSYDAWYVALAESLDCPLITLDRRLSRSTGPTCEVITPP